MPLSAVDFVPLTGQIKAASHRQFFDLLTGVMTDQPVTLANTLQIGGSQGAGAAPVRINGVAAQTANMVEIRKLAADVQPEFVVGPTGTLAWGPGGAVGTDVTLARSAANQLTLTGLAGTPALVIPVGGLQVSAGGVTVAGGITVSSGSLAFGAAASLIIPGATSLSLRNNANNADNLSLTDAGAATIRGQLTVGNGLTVAANSIVVPQPGQTATFGLDANTGSVAVANAGSLGVFGATNNFGGLLLVHDITNGEAALVLVAQTSTFLVFQSGTSFSVTGGAASKTSVYLTSGAVTIQNNVGATHNYQFLSLRSRGLA